MKAVEEGLETDNGALEKITELVRHWQQVLNMMHWKIDVIPLREDDVGEFRARAYSDNPEYLHAAVGFDDGIVDPNDEEGEITVVHELLHVLMSPSTRAAENMVNSLSTEATAGIAHLLFDPYEKSTETFCEHLARALVSLRYREADIDNWNYMNSK